MSAPVSDPVVAVPEPGVAAGSTRDPDRVWCWTAVAASAVAGVLHVVAWPHAFRESTVLGVLFVLVSAGQVGLALLLPLTRHVALLLAALVAQVAVVAVYVGSRTVDLPFMPFHDLGHSVGHLPVLNGVGNGIPIYPGARIESVGVVDLACLDAELVLVAALVALLPAVPRRRTATVLMLLGVLALGLRAGGVLG